MRLAKDGYDLLAQFNANERGARATAASVRKQGRKATVLRADLHDADEVHDLARAVSQHEDLQVVVHNAGTYDRQALAGLSDAAWRRTLAINLDAPALLTRNLLPQLTAGARIVFVSSIVAFRGSAHGAAYAAAKAGLLGLTRSLAAELAPRGIRVNAVAPGYVDTAILAGDSAGKRKARIAEVPLGRIGAPNDVAGVIAFLAGPDSAYMTGQVLHVNGGLWPT